MPITPNTLDFLFENRINNSKEWFHAHKKEYQDYLLHPLEDLVNALAPTMRELDPECIISPKPTGSFSRIYRDTRFTKDKSIYRDHMWLIFSRDRKSMEGLPAFFCDISGDGFFYGVCLWRNPPSIMRRYRALIQQRSPLFVSAQERIKAQDRFAPMGDRYKRSKAPDESEEIRDWLDRKEATVGCLSAAFDQMFSDQFADLLAEGFRILKPVYDFFMEVEHRIDLDQ